MGTSSSSTTHTWFVRVRRVGVILLLTAMALWLRKLAADELPVDFDEPVYYETALYYGEQIRDGTLENIPEYTVNYEHPPLFKLLYGWVFVTFGPEEWKTGTGPAVPSGGLGRYTSMVLGTLTALLVAIANPIAGFFAATHTYSIKYTSQFYIEALPLLTSTVTALAYLRSRGKFNGWLVLSAITMGMTAASKYIYAVVGFAIMVDWTWGKVPALLSSRVFHRTRTRQEKKESMPSLTSDGSEQAGAYMPLAPFEKNWFRQESVRDMMIMLGWGILAIGVFFLCDPYLWPAPVHRLMDSILFSANYSQSEHVANSGFPGYQPIVWLIQSVPWHPDTIFTTFEGFMVILALLGLGRAWKENRLVVIWWAVGMLFLFAWPTKWPQYILIVITPAALCAGAGASQVRDWYRQRPSYYGK